MHKNANVIQKKTFKRQWSWIKYFLSCCFYFYAFSACQFMGKKGESIDLSTFGYSLHVRDPCIKKSITEKGISCCLCQNYICWDRHTERERERLTEEDEIRKASKHGDVVKRIYHHACLLQTVVDCVVLRRILNFFYFSFVIVVVVAVFILQHWINLHYGIKLCTYAYIEG